MEKESAPSSIVSQPNSRSRDSCVHDMEVEAMEGLYGAASARERVAGGPDLSSPAPGIRIPLALPAFPSTYHFDGTHA
jgi:hypothetical protein